MATDKDILAIFAKHTNWQDEGDRRAVADFLGRDPDAVDPFGPETDENRAKNVETDDEPDADDKRTDKTTPVRPNPDNNPPSGANMAKRK